MAFLRTPRTARSKDPGAVATPAPPQRTALGSILLFSPRRMFGAPTSFGSVDLPRLPAFEDFHMTSRFPGPWRIAEFPNGFAVYDATGRQLGFFYGRAYPNTAGRTGFVMIDEARQIAVDFARLPELLKQTSDRSEVATSPEDDKLAKLETNRSPQDVPETSRLPRAAQLSVITVTGSPLVKAPTTIRRSVPFEPDRRRSTQMLRRRRDPVSIRTKFLIAVAVAVLPAGYFMFESSDRPVDVAVAPRFKADIPPVEFLPLREAQAPAAIPSVEFLPLQAPTAAAVGRESIIRLAGSLDLGAERVGHPWKIVVHSLIMFHLLRMHHLSVRVQSPPASAGLPLNLFDAMRVVVRKPFS